MVKFGQKACGNMFSAGIHELTAKIAPIVPAFGIGVSAGLSMRVDKFLICLVIQSTDYGLFRSLVFLIIPFTTIELLLIWGVGQDTVATPDLYTLYATTGHKIVFGCPFISQGRPIGSPFLFSFGAIITSLRVLLLTVVLASSMR
ncbi:hypothetical protein AYI70_g5598 [Smittium culicis]|uniref:Uncharacterized protein n=1 Tax=Smittium culicis TaxID=133412 RepID=A0A1R1XTS3_9FUNG|nr:hypothetical protein AYI70_g5598 [Smittium culicis]